MTMSEARRVLEKADYELEIACRTLAATQVLRRGNPDMPDAAEASEAAATIRRLLDAKRTNYIRIDQTKTAAMLAICPTHCQACSQKNCLHRMSIRRLPAHEGGLGLCPNLKEELA